MPRREDWILGSFLHIPVSSGTLSEPHSGGHPDPPVRLGGCIKPGGSFLSLTEPVDSPWQVWAPWGPVAFPAFPFLRLERDWLSSSCPMLLFFFLPCCMACGILVSRPGIEPGLQQEEH